ncbi:MAG: methyltransferase family protein [Actinomycetota bacterium]
MARLPDLGPRGEGYVLGQFLLVVAVAVVAALVPRWPAGLAGALRVVGLASVTAGFGLFALAVRDLGTSLTAYPRPGEGAALRTGGIYARVRHPIYGGLALLAVGWSFVRGPLALVPTAALVALLVAKSIREEAFLVERYPDYAAYRERVRRRFIPGIV